MAMKAHHAMFLFTIINLFALSESELIAKYIHETQELLVSFTPIKENARHIITRREVDSMVHPVFTSKLKTKSTINNCVTFYNSTPATRYDIKVQYHHRIYRTTINTPINAELKIMSLNKNNFVARLIFYDANVVPNSKIQFYIADSEDLISGNGNSRNISCNMKTNDKILNTIEENIDMDCWVFNHCDCDEKGAMHNNKLYYGLIQSKQGNFYKVMLNPKELQRVLACDEEVDTVNFATSVDNIGNNIENLKQEGSYRTTVICAILICVFVVIVIILLLWKCRNNRMCISCRNDQQITSNAILNENQKTKKMIYKPQIRDGETLDLNTKANIHTLPNQNTSIQLEDSMDAVKLICPSSIRYSSDPLIPKKTKTKPL